MSDPFYLQSIDHAARRIGELESHIALLESALSRHGPDRIGDHDLTADTETDADYCAALLAAEALIAARERDAAQGAP